MKKTKIWVGLLGLLMAGVVSAAVFNPYVFTKFTDLMADNFRVTTITMGNHQLDASITLPSSSSALYNTQLPVYNPTASSIPAGTVLIASNTGAGYVNIAPATIDLTNTIGFAAQAISATSRGWMIPRGSGYALALTTGTVAIGDVLVTSGTVAGRLGTDNTPTTGADVAVALTAGVAAGSTVLVIAR